MASASWANLVSPARMSRSSGMPHTSKRIFRRLFQSIPSQNQDTLVSMRNSSSLTSSPTRRSNSYFFTGTSSTKYSLVLPS